MEEKIHITLKQNQRNQNVVSYIGPVKYIFSYCWVTATASLVPDNSQCCDFVLVFNHVCWPWLWWYFGIASHCISLGGKPLNAFESVRFELLKHRPPWWDTGLAVPMPQLKDRPSTCEGFRHLVPTGQAAEHSLHTSERKRALKLFLSSPEESWGRDRLWSLQSCLTAWCSMPSPAQGRSWHGKGSVFPPQVPRHSTLYLSKPFSQWKGGLWGALDPVRVPLWPIPLHANQCHFKRQRAVVMLSDKPTSQWFLPDRAAVKLQRGQSVAWLKRLRGWQGMIANPQRWRGLHAVPCSPAQITWAGWAQSTVCRTLLHWAKEKKDPEKCQHVVSFSFFISKSLAWLKMVGAEPWCESLLALVAPAPAHVSRVHCDSCSS